MCLQQEGNVMIMILQGICNPIEKGGTGVGLCRSARVGSRVSARVHSREVLASC